MFTWLRSRIRFAGRIGWIDGRRGYPGEDQYVEMLLSRPGSRGSETGQEDTDLTTARPAQAEAGGVRALPAAGRT